MAFKPPAPTPPGLWRRVPPAIFPSIMGLFGLGLAWRRSAGAFDIPGGVGEALLGAVTLLFLFSVVAYAVKMLRRPSVIVDEVTTLPGRAGLATMVLSLYLLSITLLPYVRELARAVLWGGFCAHAVLVGVLVHQFFTGPQEQRRVTPVWHLSYVGVIIGALAAAGLEYYLTTLILFAFSAVMAGLIWAVSAEQLVKVSVPAPLRPLLAIHLSPVALLGLVAQAMGLDAVSLGCAGIAGLLLVFFLARARWLTEAGFSALWGAFTFPLAATASLWLALGGAWRIAGGFALVLATLVVLPIAWKVLRSWAGGQLAVKTNAATA